MADVLAAQFSTQPGAREPPLATDRSCADTQRFRRFLERQATEESELEDLALPLVALGETLQSQVDRDDLLEVFG
jgi:hypothetical protein